MLQSNFFRFKQKIDSKSCPKSQSQRRPEMMKGIAVAVGLSHAPRGNLAWRNGRSVSKGKQIWLSNFYN
jgi:hypothetical protein